MNFEGFERRCQEQRLRGAPPEWRDEILDNVRQATKLAPPRVRRRVPSWWWQLVGPSPVSWAAIAAAWTVILSVNVTLANARVQRTDPIRLTGVSARSFLEQKALLDQVLEASDRSAPASASVPKTRPVLPRSRSEGSPEWAIA